MKFDNFYAVLDELAAKSISDEYCKKYGAYDNSGVLMRLDDEVRGAVFSLDFSLGAIERAIREGANVLVTHHPAIYGSISAIDGFSPLGKKIALCCRHGISVVSMHLNLDCAADGIDESLALGVTASAAGKRESLRGVTVRDKLDGGCGYGRAYDVSQTTVAALRSAMEKEFSTHRVEAYANGVEWITRVASFCGSGADEQSIEFALQNGAQLVVSSDFKHHVLSMAAETGVAVLTLTHYASENYGFEKYYEKIRQRVTVPCVYHTDEHLL